MQTNIIYVLDLETTGLDYLYDRILEVAIYELNLENYSYKKVYDKVIKQDITQHFIQNCWVVQQNYITLDEIDHGIYQETAIREVKRILQDQDWTSFNVKFDGKFLIHQFKITLKQPRVCLMKNTTDIVRIPGHYDEFKWPKLQEAYYYFFNEQMPEKHRAGPDTQLAVEIAIALHKFQQTIILINEAMEKKQCIVLNYTDKKNDKTYDRKVQPLEFKRGYTLIEGFDYLRNENRTFSIVRINKISLNA